MQLYNRLLLICCCWLLETAVLVHLCVFLPTCVQQIKDPHDLIHTIFGELHGDSTARTTQHLTTRALLTPRNEEVNYLNDTCMAAFPGE